MSLVQAGNSWLDPAQIIGITPVGGSGRYNSARVYLNGGAMFTVTYPLDTDACEALGALLPEPEYEAEMRRAAQAR